MTEFAKIITGWSVDPTAIVPGYKFRPHAQEPGTKKLLGETFPDGEIGGLAAINFLANHPATYRHLARKLATHFVSDHPPPEVCAHLEGTLRGTRGDLLAASLALVDMPQVWSPPGGPLCKLRSPLDYVIAAVRALGLPREDRPDMPGLLATLGQPMWNAPAPNGWDDQANSWASPESVLLRIDWAYRLSSRIETTDAAGLAKNALGSLIRPATLDAIQHAGLRRDALTLALASPEFMRR